MKIKLIGSALVAALFLAMGSVAPANAQAQRNYDCSKPGNANKTVCKAAAKPAVVAKVAPAARNYDCTKAGNATKAACKGHVAVPPAARPAAAPAARNYDCSKAGNANKTACKGAVAPAPRAAPAAASAPARAPSAATNATGPQGATAKCRDNTYSHSKTHTGSCSHHGGVAQWY